MKPRRILRWLLAGAILLPGPYALPAVAEDTSAVAVNLRDGRSVFRLSFHVKRTMDSQVDNDNAAVAFSSCESCRTVAISFQIVLALGDVDSLTTDNLAIAINQQCFECETMAAAYQYVFGNGAPVRFTPAGQQQLSQLRRQLGELRNADLTLQEMGIRIDQIAEGVAGVLEQELVALGPPESTGETPPGDESTEDGSSGSTTTTDGDTPTTTTTTGPTTSTSGDADSSSTTTAP